MIERYIIEVDQERGVQTMQQTLPECMEKIDFSNMPVLSISGLIALYRTVLTGESKGEVYEQPR